MDRAQQRLTVDSWRTDDDCLHAVTVLGAALKNHLVHVPMKCLIRKMCELIDAVEIVELLFRPCAESGVVVFRVEEGQNTRATSVQPVSGILSGMPFNQTRRNGFGSAFVVRGVSGI